MSSKKKTKAAKKAVEAEEVDIKDIDTIFEDMKKMALNVEDDSADSEDAVQDDLTNSEPSDTEPKGDVVECIEGKDDSVEDAAGNDAEESAVSDDPAEGVTEEVAHADSDDEKNDETEEDEKPKPRRRKTYQEMFGGTWLGYGYDTY